MSVATLDQTRPKEPLTGHVDVLVVGAGISVVVSQALGAGRRDQADAVARAALGASSWVGAFCAAMALGASGVQVGTVYLCCAEATTSQVHRAALLSEAQIAVPPLAERYLRLDGSVVDVEVTAAPYADEPGLSTQVVVRDITERRQAETSKHQRIGEDGVEHEDAERDPEHDACPSRRADERTQDSKEQCRQKTELDDEDIARRKCGHFRLLPKRKQYGLRIEEERHRQKHVEDRNPHAHADGAPHGDHIATTIGLRHHRDDGHRKARTEDEDREEELPRKHHGGERYGPELTDNHDIRRVDPELCQLCPDQGNAERERRTDMRHPAAGAGECWAVGRDIGVHDFGLNEKSRFQDTGERHV
mgnify:CR=1 FL=1